MIGVPDDEWGENVVAVVVRNKVVPIAQEVVDACEKMLAPYKKPRSVIFIESIPRSHYGKVLRAELPATVKQTRKPIDVATAELQDSVWPFDLSLRHYPVLRSESERRVVRKPARSQQSRDRTNG